MDQTHSKIRIVIPAYRAETTILKCVEAILVALKNLNSWEVIIVDNGPQSTLIEILKNYPIKVFHCNKFQSAAFARNEGVKDFSDGIIVFIDSDVICEKNCIENLIQPLFKNVCDGTIGNYSTNTEGLSFSQKYKQLYIHHIYARKNRGIRNDFWTAICAIDAKIYHQLQGFNTAFKGANGEDQEFGIRMSKNGFKVHSVELANGQHLNPYGVFNIIKNDFRKGRTAIKNSLDHNVSILDNRHAKITDVSSVIFSVITLTSMVFAIFSSGFLLVSLFAFLLWIGCRISLNHTFLKYGGIIFFLPALGLMFLLDLVRFICVLNGVFTFKLLPLFYSEKNHISLNNL